jgi:hypothetical protein
MDSYRHAKKLVKEFLSWAITRLTAACSWALKVCTAGIGGTLIGRNVGGVTLVEGTAEVVTGLVVVTVALVVVGVFVGGAILVDWVVDGAAVDGWVEGVGEGSVAVVGKAAVVAVVAGSVIEGVSVTAGSTEVTTGRVLDVTEAV